MEVASFYLTLEDCKFEDMINNYQIGYGFYLTLEDCKSGHGTVITSSASVFI